MVGHAAHGNTAIAAAFPAGKRYIENGRSALGILKKHLIEISQPEKKDGIVRKGFFDCLILAYHGGERHGIPQTTGKSSVLDFNASARSCSRVKRSCYSRLFLTSRGENNFFNNLIDLLRRIFFLGISYQLVVASSFPAQALCTACVCSWGSE